jgi:crossover junction endodeoxyribonuclease RuvC
MRVIGVDPGSRICGYGVLETRNGELVHIESGCISPPNKFSLPLRLKIIFEGLREVIDRSSPDVMSIEDVFFSKNSRSALKLGEARGVALLAATISGIPVHEYAPAEVKLALTGQGRANKIEVQKMISLILGVTKWDTKDSSDAVAIALCHINTSQINERFGRGVIKPRRRRRRWTKYDISSSG